MVEITRDVAAGRRDLVVANDYDELGRVAEQSHPSGEVDVFDYAVDAGGMTLRVDHTAGPLTETVTYRHDLSGRLVVVTDPFDETAGGVGIVICRWRWCRVGARRRRRSLMGRVGWSRWGWWIRCCRARRRGRWG